MPTVHLIAGVILPESVFERRGADWKSGEAAIDK
jgi:hypothetical protein